MLLLMLLLLLLLLLCVRSLQPSVGACCLMMTMMPLTMVANEAALCGERGRL